MNYSKFDSTALRFPGSPIVGKSEFSARNGEVGPREGQMNIGKAGRGNMTRVYDLIDRTGGILNDAEPLIEQRMATPVAFPQGPYQPGSIARQAIPSQPELYGHGPAPEPQTPFVEAEYPVNKGGFSESSAKEDAYARWERAKSEAPRGIRSFTNPSAKEDAYARWERAKSEAPEGIRSFTNPKELDLSKELKNNAPEMRSQIPDMEKKMSRKDVYIPGRLGRAGIAGAVVAADHFIPRASNDSFMGRASNMGRDFASTFAKDFGTAQIPAVVAAGVGAEPVAAGVELGGALYGGLHGAYDVASNWARGKYSPDGQKPEPFQKLDRKNAELMRPGLYR